MSTNVSPSPSFTLTLNKAKNFCTNVSLPPFPYLIIYKGKKRNSSNKMVYQNPIENKNKNTAQIFIAANPCPSL